VGKVLLTTNYIALLSQAKPGITSDLLRVLIWMIYGFWQIATTYSAILWAQRNGNLWHMAFGSRPTYRPYCQCLALLIYATEPQKKQPEGNPKLVMLPQADHPIHQDQHTPKTMEASNLLGMEPLTVLHIPRVSVHPCVSNLSLQPRIAITNLFIAQGFGVNNKEALYSL